MKFFNLAFRLLFLQACGSRSLSFQILGSYESISKSLNYQLAWFKVKQTQLNLSMQKSVCFKSWTPRVYFNMRISVSICSGWQIKHFFIIIFFIDISYSLIHISMVHYFDYFFTKVSKMKLFLYFSLRQKKSRKVDFIPICTLYYIKWHPNSRFPNLRSFPEPQKPRIWRYYCLWFDL